MKRPIAGLNQFNRPEIFKALHDLKTDKVPFVNLLERKGQHQHTITEEVMKEVQWICGHSQFHSGNPESFGIPSACC